MLIPLALAATIVGIAIPHLLKARPTSAINACINNQRQIDSAIQQYAIEQKVPAGAPVPSEEIIGSYIKGGMPRCPKDGARYEVSGTVDDLKIACSNARSDPHGHPPLHP